MDTTEWVRAIAVARILMPRAMVRLSAGRLQVSREAQALAFLAGANSIFTGEKLLTTANPEFDADLTMLEAFGMTAREPDKDTTRQRIYEPIGAGAGAAEDGVPASLA